MTQQELSKELEIVLDSLLSIQEVKTFDELQKIKIITLFERRFPIDSPPTTPELKEWIELLKTATILETDDMKLSILKAETNAAIQLIDIWEETLAESAVKRLIFSTDGIQNI